MPPKVQCFLFCILPLLAFVPIFIGSRLHNRTVPASFDWIIIVGSSGLVICNPFIRSILPFWKRTVVFIISFGVCGAFLFFLSFALMAFIFHEGL